MSKYKLTDNSKSTKKVEKETKQIIIENKSKTNKTSSVNITKKLIDID
jgi:hypothetical protein